MDSSIVFFCNSILNVNIHEKILQIEIVETCKKQVTKQPNTVCLVYRQAYTQILMVKTLMLDDSLHDLKKLP